MTASIGRIARQLLEKKIPQHGALAPDGGPEKDMNDQIVVGTYQTKSFEMSDKAQKLYSDLPKDTNSEDAEQAAIHLDKLLDLFRNASATQHISPQDLSTAKDHVEKIHDLASNMKLEKEHRAITSDIMRHLEDFLVHYPERVIDPEDHVHPADDPRFKTDSKDYNTDKTNDRDIDNVRRFLIRRGQKAQRKIKIIDVD